MWSIIITVGLQIIGWILTKVGASQEAKKKFFEFVKLAANDVNSVKLQKWGDEQLKWLNENPWVEHPIKKNKT